MKKKQLSPFQQVTRSISTLPAQTDILCEPGNDKLKQLHALVTGYIQSNSMPATIRLLLDVMLSSGCRVSAAINPAGFDVLYTGAIRLFEPKTKYYTIVNLTHSAHLIERYKGGKCFLLACYSRFQVYRLFIRLGIQAEFDGLTKTSVCHSTRHIVGALTYASTKDIDSVSRVLNHSNKNNSNYYVKKTKSRS